MSELKSHYISKFKIKKKGYLSENEVIRNSFGRQKMSKLQGTTIVDDLQTYVNLRKTRGEDTKNLTRIPQ